MTLPPRQCVICSAWFTPKSWNAAGCSPACKLEIGRRYAAEKREAKRAEGPKPPKKPVPAHVGPPKCLTCGGACKRYECPACFEATQIRVSAGIVAALAVWQARGGTDGRRKVRTSE